MGQMKLFESTEHLERCFEDPDPYAVEAVYYTPWYILYPDVPVQVARVIDLNRNVIELRVDDEAA